MTNSDIAFSFKYDGNVFYSKEHSFTQTPDGMVYTIENGVTVTAKISEYPEHDAFGWVLYFENKSGKNSEVISDVCDIDLDLNIKHTPFPRMGYKPVEGNLRVVSMNGMVEGYHYTENDPKSATEYGFSEAFLKDRREYRNLSGRSSDGTLPFFDIKGLDGAMVAIGWTGSWKAEFENKNGLVGIKCGLAKTGFYLKDGEKLRTASVLIMTYGENEDSSNKFRKLIKEHYSHKACTPAVRDGIFAFELWGGLPSEEMKKRLETLKEHGISFEDIWIDAGWYGNCTNCAEAFSGDWYKHTGNWFVNKRVHPDSLCDVRDTAAKNNSNLMLWFEPERAVANTEKATEHPEWFLSLPGNENNPNASKILYYGNEDAKQYVKDLLCDYIKKLDLSVYRQDFNCSIREFFDAADEKDRVGITEIYHITGMYEVWDHILNENPGLLIDNCSSGGRRIDIETISRSIPFFRSDYQCEFNANGDVLQAHNNISTYLPYNGSTSKVKSDDYDVRSSYSSSWGGAFYNTVFQTMDENDLAWAKKIHDEYRRIRKYFSENFYSHASKTYDPSSWAVFQYHDEKEQSGTVLAFRRSESPFDKMTIDLCGIEKGRLYSVENFDTAEIFESDGSFEISLPQKRSCVIFEYKIK